MAIAADAKPPSTSAPSPPITTMPRRAGTATQSAVKISGPARTSVFCPGERRSETAEPEERKELDWRLAEDEQKYREQQTRGEYGEDRNDDGLGRSQDPTEQIAGSADGGSIEIGLCRCCHGQLPREDGRSRPELREFPAGPADQVIEPTTPSTRKLVCSSHTS